MSSKHKSTPPKLACRLLLWFLKEELAEEVLGDLDEKFYHIAAQRSVLRAKANYWHQVFQYLRPFAMKKQRSNSKLFIMVQHNFKLSYRTFIRYKSSFLINLAGLSSGLACTLLIFLWIADELAMDKFHEKDEQLYQVYLNHEENGTIRTAPPTPGILAEALANEVPEVVTAVEDTDMDWFGNNFALSAGKEKIKARGKFSGKDYLNLFSFKLRSGDPEQVLDDKSSVVITESLALKLFGSLDVIGKSVDWNLLHFKGQAKVSGILYDLSDNSSDQFDFILPFAIFKDDLDSDGMHWGNFNSYTYAELAKGANVKQLNKKLANFIKQKDEGSNVTVFVTKFSDIYLHGNYEGGVQTGGRIIYVTLFSIIGIFILLITCINFMNLTTARASRRLKEIGVKKTLGARRGALFSQFMGEAIIMAVTALIIALVLVYMVIPQFNELTGKSISLQLTWTLVAITSGITLITGILAGSYPAIYLSGFKPINILKGKLNASFGEVWIRKGLVVFQFTLSIIMIVSVLVVYQQIDFAQTKNLGYDRTNVLKVPIEGKAVENIPVFLNELKQVAGVIEASCTSHSIVSSGSFTTGVSWPGKDPDQIIRFEQARVYHGLLETLDVQLAMGRSFSDHVDSEKSKIIFNETAIEAMGLENPIGTTVIMWGEEKEIIGVVKDFHYSSLHSKVEPLLFHFDTEFLQNVFIKIDSRQIGETISAIESFYNKFNSGYTLDYEFLDQNYQAQYIAEQRISTLSRFFAGVAIIISCLGLFGLAAFTAERRQKEIGVRKVLGASSFRIIALLSNDFTRMVLASIVIALPVSYMLAENWLSNFAYHIQLKWWLFGLAAVSSLVIAWLTVGIQTIKAALINPVECLKDE